VPDPTLIPELPSLHAIRRNHALEHATIHVLSKQFPRYRFIGRSDFNGFYLLTMLPMEPLVEGVQLALRRLQAGEKHLAVHPNCGTNLLTSAFLASLSAMLVFNIPRSRKRWTDQLELLPAAVLGALLSLVVAQPVGNALQKRVTTLPELHNSRLVSVTARQSGKYTLYRIQIRHN